MEKHGGVKALQGRGSVISPTDRNLHRATGPKLRTANHNRSFPRLETETSSKQLTILIVEDEPLIRVALQEFLEKRGHACAHACTAEEALELARHLMFDAALLDVSLKDKQVYPVVRALQDKGVRCIFVGGYLREDLPTEFANVRTIAKPFAESAVLDAIAECGA